jgi:hypothetical protein
MKAPARTEDARVWCEFSYVPPSRVSREYPA